MNALDLGTLIHSAMEAVINECKCDSGSMYTELHVKEQASKAVNALAEAILGTTAADSAQPSPPSPPPIPGLLSSRHVPAQPTTQDIDKAIAAFEDSEDDWSVYRDYEKRQMAFKAGMRFAAQHQPRLSVTLPQRLSVGEHGRMTPYTNGVWINADQIKARLVNLGITVHEEA